MRGRATAADRPGEPGCPLCNGSGVTQCGSCGGAGKLPWKGGFAQKTAIKPNRVVGTKWTSRQKHLGRDYFECIEKRKLGNHTFVLMKATTSPSTRLWLNLSLLKDKASWMPGWQEGFCRTSPLKGNPAREQGAECPVCDRSSGWIQCPRCYASRAVVDVN